MDEKLEHGEIAAGVNIQHPSFRDAVRNMTKRGAKNEEIMKVTGLPPEAVEQLQRDQRLKKSG